jgi:hypothetical protein
MEGNDLSNSWCKTGVLYACLVFGLAGCADSDPQKDPDAALSTAADAVLVTAESGLAKGKQRRTLSPTPEDTTTPVESSPSTPEPAPSGGQEQTSTDVAASIPMSCVEGYTAPSGAYLVENNAWGKGSITDFYQCAGIGPVRASDGTVSARWTWQWPHPPGAGEIKGYPAVIFGQKPGKSATPGSGLPKVVDSIGAARAAWQTSSTAVTFQGSGQLTFDIWLTVSGAASNRFMDVPKTHEIMIVVDNYGGYGVPPNRNPAWYVERATIAGIPFYVYRGQAGVNWSNPWDFLVLQVVAPMPVGAIDLRAVLDYFKGKGWITGREYMASVEFGSEIAKGGTGDVVLQSYKVEVK